MLTHKLNHLLTHSTTHHGWQIINTMSKPPPLITIVFLLLRHAALSRPLITVYKYHTLRLCNHPKPLWVCDGLMHRDLCHHHCIQYMSQPCADLGWLYMWLMLLKPPWITTAAHTFLLLLLLFLFWITLRISAPGYGERLQLLNGATWL